jgi:hypothetical protein
MLRQYFVPPIHERQCHESCLLAFWLECVSLISLFEDHGALRGQFTFVNLSKLPLAPISDLGCPIRLRSWSALHQVHYLLLM